MGPPLVPFPSHHRPGPVLKFHTKAQTRVTPPMHRNTAWPVSRCPPRFSRSKRVTPVLVFVRVRFRCFSQRFLSDHLKTGQRRSGQNRPTRVAGTGLFYSAGPFGGKLVFVRQLRGPHLSTCP